TSISHHLFSSPIIIVKLVELVHCLFSLSPVELVVLPTTTTSISHLRSPSPAAHRRPRFLKLSLSLSRRRFVKDSLATRLSLAVDFSRSQSSLQLVDLTDDGKTYHHIVQQPGQP
ncbi:hypothetical protein Dimus_010515, partial [Dionaea muscipula]